MHPDFCNRSKVSAFSVKDSIVFANFSLVFFDTTQICAKKPWMTPMSQSKFFVCVSKDLNPVLLAFCSNKARYSSSSESSSSLPPSLLSSFVDLSLFFFFFSSSSALSFFSRSASAALPFPSESIFDVIAWLLNKLAMKSAIFSFVTVDEDVNVAGSSFATFASSRWPKCV